MAEPDNPIIVVQGGQWGSEGKGAVAAALCVTREVEFAVRTGAINAGHTVYYKGKPYAMQQLPTGWINPNTELVIGPGAYIHPPTLFKEIGWIEEAMGPNSVIPRLHIDYRCGVHRNSHQDESAQSNRHHAIGATGKGCAEAIVDKILNRNTGYKLFSQLASQDFGSDRDIKDYRRVNRCMGDTADILNSAYDRECKILIEGTQGHHLDLHLGPYPFTTSRMTTAANWIAEAGLSPSLEYEVVMVIRTYPIRVAGNSGPMPGEIEWVDLARDLNGKRQMSGLDPLIPEVALTAWEHTVRAVAEGAKYSTPVITRQCEWTMGERDQFREAASELYRDALIQMQIHNPDHARELAKLFELTTVTRKIRRIASLNLGMLKRAVTVERPSWICVTFADYIEPLIARTTQAQYVDPHADAKDPVWQAFDRMDDWLNQLDDSLGVPVQAFTTGPLVENYIERNV